MTKVFSVVASFITEVTESFPNGYLIMIYYYRPTLTAEQSRRVPVDIVASTPVVKILRQMTLDDRVKHRGKFLASILKDDSVIVTGEEEKEG